MNIDRDQGLGVSLVIVTLAATFGTANLLVTFVEYEPPPEPVLVSETGTLFLGQGQYAWGPYNFKTSYHLTGRLTTNATVTFSVYSTSNWNEACACPIGGTYESAEFMTNLEVDFRIGPGQYLMVIRSTNPNATVTFATALIAVPIT